MLASVVRKGETLLDVPVGTGRYFSAYKKLGVYCVGLDFAEDMLEQARAKIQRLGAAERITVHHGSIFELPRKTKFATTVCVRMLHLLGDKEMVKAMEEVSVVTTHNLILTTQLGERYSVGLEVATHDERKFRALLARLKWSVAEEQRLTAAGWYVMRLERM